VAGRDIDNEGARVARAARGERRLLQVIRDELGHLEHRYLALAAEHGLQLFVGIDETTIDRILQFVLLM
jgi:hypothetical protein